MSEFEKETIKDVGAFKEHGDEKVQDIRIHGNLGSEDLSKYDEGGQKIKDASGGNTTINIIIVTPEVDQKGILGQLANSMRKSPGMDIIRKIFGD